MTTTTAKTTPAQKAANAKKAAAQADAFKNALASSGWTGAVLNAFPELKGIFSQAVKGKWTPEKFAQQVRTSKWYQSRSDTQRQFDLLEKNDPKSFAQRQAQVQADIVSQAAQLGVPVTPARAAQIARLSARNGLDQSQLQATLGAELHYDPAASYGGVVGQSMDKIKSTAADYMIKVGDTAMASWATQVAEGKSDPQAFQDWAVQQTKLKYAHLSDQLDKGITLQQIADPYRQALASTLEIDPNSVSNDDPMIAQALSYRGSDNNGAVGLMPQYDFTSKVRKDPRWLNTQNAKSSLLSTLNTLTQTFGVHA